MRKAVFLTLLFSCSTLVPPMPSASPVAGPKLPRIQGEKLPQLLESSLLQMVDAVGCENEFMLMGRTDPDVNGRGIMEFRRKWRREPHWQELYDILNFGGDFEPGSNRTKYWVPRVYVAWPEAFDADSFVCAIGRVAMRESADPHSKVIAVLNWDILKRLGEPGHVRTADGRVGWVEPRSLHGKYDYRAAFVERGGSWKMIEFVTGR